MAEGIVELITTSSTKSEEEEIWGIVRTWLGIFRIVVFFSIILITEIFAEYLFKGWSVGIWALIIGIPLFFVISIVLIAGDKRLAPEGDHKRVEKSKAIQESLGKKAVLRPIRKRL